MAAKDLIPSEARYGGRYPVRPPKEVAQNDKRDVAHFDSGPEVEHGSLTRDPSPVLELGQEKCHCRWARLDKGLDDRRRLVLNAPFRLDVTDVSQVYEIPLGLRRGA